MNLSSLLQRSVELRFPHLLVALAALAGCTEDPAPAPPEVVPDSSQSALTPPRTGVGFDGVTAVLAGEDRVHVWWQPLIPAAGTQAGRYRVRAMPSDGDQPTPTVLDTEPGVGFAVLEDLTPGLVYRISVHSLDEHGREDDNRMVLRAMPNPVRFVSCNATDGGDGRAPASAWRTLNQALEETIDLPGLNLYLEGGRYLERLLLFEGQMIYGGFDPEFSVHNWNPAARPSVLSAPGRGDLVSVVPGGRWCGLAGLELDGGDHSGRGVVADDCRLQLVQVEAHGFVRKGIHLRGEEDEWSMVRVRMARCTIRDNGGEGVSIRGIADVHLEACILTGNGQEALEAKPLCPSKGRTSQIVLDGCLLADNKDQAMNLNLAIERNALGNTGTMRVGLLGNRILRNQRAAVSIDVQFVEQDGIPLVVDVRDNVLEGNGGLGLHLDVDAPGRWLVRGNQISSDVEEPALRLSGDAAMALVVVEENQFGPVPAVAADLQMAGTILGTGNQLQSDHAAALRHGRGWVDVEQFLATRPDADTKVARPFAWLDWTLPVRLSRPPGLVSGSALVLAFPVHPQRWPQVRPDALVALPLPEQSLWRCALQDLAPGTDFLVTVADGLGGEFHLPYRRGAPWPTSGAVLDVLPATDLVHLTVESTNAFWILDPTGDGPWRFLLDGPGSDRQGTLAVRMRKDGKVCREQRLPLSLPHLTWHDLDLAGDAPVRLELAVDHLESPLPLMLSLDHDR